MIGLRKDKTTPEQYKTLSPKLLLGLSVMFLISIIPVSFAEETKNIFVGDTLQHCVGVGPMECMMVRQSQDSEWQYFYDLIQGFQYESGYQYELKVKVTDVENPPADASSLRYELIQVVSKTSTQNTRHIPYNGVCAPGYVSLGEICVLNDRCGPGAYAGKVCTMDGKTQLYLKPLHQGKAGLSASNVICAEPLQLMFKHDITPVCVKSDSIHKLEERGWSTQQPVVACTLQYAPVCGVDGKTYGNMCMINAEHVAIKHTGECNE